MNRYGQPIGGPHTGYPTANTSTAVINQTRPQVVNVMNTQFGTKPVSITCQFCKAPVTTVVEKSCNCCSCLLCWFTCLVFWICVQCCRNKEITCCDAKHTCPNCGQTLGYYNTC